eukprot:1156727-Pelagomonas_calceolata.AAC.1
MPAIPAMLIVFIGPLGCCVQRWLSTVPARIVNTRVKKWWRFISLLKKVEKEKKRKEKKRKYYACQVWPRALRKGQLKGRAPPHRPRGRGGTE